MADKKIVVTISGAVQIGADEWKQVRTSRVFAINRSIKDMIGWAEAEGIENANISDLTFSEYTGESI